MANFRVGQKVVCIDDEFNPRFVVPGTTLPTRGCVYTVREIVPHSFGAAIRLAEIFNAPGEYTHDDTGESVEAAFPCHRFRPLVDKPTDISVFKEMLQPAKLAGLV